MESRGPSWRVRLPLGGLLYGTLQYGRRTGNIRKYMPLFLLFPCCFLIADLPAQYAYSCYDPRSRKSSTVLVLVRPSSDYCTAGLLRVETIGLVEPAELSPTVQ